MEKRLERVYVCIKCLRKVPDIPHEPPPRKCVCCGGTVVLKVIVKPES